MSKRGVLLINLGSPNSPSVPDVRRYLREFLMDGRVLDAPYPIRWFVVHGMILPTRPHQSAEAYEKIWSEEGPPLVVTTEKLAKLVAAKLDRPVAVAMRYQNPSPTAALNSLIAQGVDEVDVVALFPHYAMSSFETAVEHVKAAAVGKPVTLRFAKPYYNRPDYISALAAVASPYLEQGYDHLLFSFHGLPVRHLRKSDPTGSHCMATARCCETPSPAHDTCYRAQCFATVRAFVAETGLDSSRYSVAFQSRLGRDPWMEPFTDAEVQRLAKSGVKRLVVMCPAFVADCLETLEEIAMRGKEVFLEAGGESFQMIPCLNLHPKWVDSLSQIVQEIR